KRGRPPCSADAAHGGRGRHSLLFDQLGHNLALASSERERLLSPESASRALLPRHQVAKNAFTSSHTSLKAWRRSSGRADMNCSFERSSLLWICRLRSSAGSAPIAAPFAEAGAPACVAQVK